MNWEALDDPALVLPRVLDVHGTFLRLGFTGHTRRGTNFYWKFVPLFGGGIPGQYSARHISHVHLTLTAIDDSYVRLQASYGYPERYRKKDKIILGFKPLTSHISQKNLSVYPDHYLRNAEKLIRELIDCIQNRQLVCSMQVDTAQGIENSKLEPYVALAYAVDQTIDCDFIVSQCDWWIKPPSDSPPDPIQTSAPASRYSRLPNFRPPRNVFHHVRRPV